MSERLIYVMGPSGAGKDTLFSFARHRVAPEGIVFAHRYITREERAGENHIALTRAEFDARAARGLFALQWDSHGLRYGIGIEIDLWLAQGCTVVVNGSRAWAAHALERYPRLTLVHIEAALDVLAARLAARGRENAQQIAARLARQPPLALPPHVQPERIGRIDNSGLLEDAGRAFIDIVRRVTICDNV